MRLFLVLAAGVLPFAATNLQNQAPKSINVCEILTRADMEAFAGEKLRRNPRESGNERMGLRTDRCAYRSDGWIISISVERGRTAKEGKESIDLFRKTSAKQPGAKSVSGLGDDAWWTPVHATSGILTVHRKGDVLTVQTSGEGTGAGSFEKTEALMKKFIALYDKAPK